MNAKFIQRAVILTAFFISGASLVRAWILPPAAPPQSNVPAPLTVGPDIEWKEGIIAVNDLYIRSIGKWASELVNFRGTQSVDFKVETNRQLLSEIRFSYNDSRCSLAQYGQYNCRIMVQKDCRAGYYVVGCSGSVVTDLRPAAPRQPPSGMAPRCSQTGECLYTAYVGSSPYPFPNGGPGVQNTGCITEVHARAYGTGGSLSRPRFAVAPGTNDAAVVYAFCAKAQ